MYRSDSGECQGVTVGGAVRQGLVAGLSAAALLLCMPALAQDYPRTLVAQPQLEQSSPAQRFRGAARIMGAPAQGERHAFVWILDDHEADQHWQWQLSGQPGRRLQVVLREGAPAPDAAGVTTFGESTAAQAPAVLAELAITPEAPVAQTAPLSIPQGEYHLEISTTGDSYELVIDTVDDAAEDIDSRARTIQDAAQAADSATSLGSRRDVATPLPVEVPQTLDIMPGQNELLTFTLDDHQAQTQRWALDIESDLETRIEVCLAHMLSEEPVCRAGPREALFDQLKLAPGQHRVTLSLAEGATPGGVTLQRRGLPQAAETVVPEPNDSRAVASELTPGQPLEGHFNGPRQAVFRLDVPRSDQRWRIVAKGDGLDDLRLYQADRSGRLHLARARHSGPLGQRDGADIEGLGFASLSLLADSYYVELSGRDTPYRLIAEPLNADDLAALGHWEQEPNDQREQANRLAFGTPLSGDVHDAADEDWFYFSLAGENRINLEITPPEQGQVVPRLYRGDALIAAIPPRRGLDDSPLKLTGLLPGGDYYLRIASREPAGRYRLQLEMAPPWEAPEGHAMATEQARADVMPADGHIRLPYSELLGDHQWFRLPVGEVPRTLRVERLGPNRLSRAPVAFVDQQGEALPVEDVEPEYDNSVAVAVEIPAQQTVYLRTHSGRRGSIELRVDDPLLAAQASGHEQRQAHIRAELTVEQPLLAWQEQPQHLESRLQLHNTDAQAHSLMLEAHASVDGWQVQGLPEQVTLDAGEQLELSPVWQWPARLDDAMPAVLYVAGAGDVLSAHVEVVDAGASALTTAVASGRPESANGLVDLAWQGLGAYFEDPQTGEPIIDDAKSGWGSTDFRGPPRLVHLIDGMSSVGSYVRYGHQAGKPLPPLRLAGDGGEVHYLVVNPRSGLPRENRWRELEISLGDSPDTLEVVTTLSLEATDGEQYFALETPRKAQFMGLRPLSFWGTPQGRDRTGIGQIRALGVPGEALAQEHPDLLADIRGGHWIYSQPEVPALNGMTLPERNAFIAQGAHSDRLGRGLSRGGDWHPEGVSMVFAFLNQRAAQLARLVWEDAPQSAGRPVERIRVMTSTESPTGPWTPQAKWQLARHDDANAELVLDTPVWARYLRLDISMPEPDPEQRRQRWQLPARIAAHEAAPLGSGRSILGDWPASGRQGQAGPFEQTGPGLDDMPRVDDAPGVDDAYSTPDAPWPLESAVTGRLAHPGDTRSYQVRVAEGDNALRLRLHERLRGKSQTQLKDEEGRTHPMEWRDQPDGGRHGVAHDLAPGVYRLDIREPLRSIAFLWDASGSLEALQAEILQAINRFAEGLHPEREVANLMPLGGPFLLQEWTGDPDVLRHTLAHYDGRFESSDAEPALQMASRAMEVMDSDRSIFLITDAEQMGRARDVWNDLNRVRPRIFTLETSHGQQRLASETRWYRNQMRSWANVGNGRYTYTSGRRDLIRAFEAAMDDIRQPTTFTLEGESFHREPPRPGTLRVVQGEQPVVAAGVVHLIFDASGSMLRQMAGGRRIEVARDIVQQVLDERVPREVPVALRAYGHTRPHSCESELLVAPETGSHADVREAVSAIQAVNLARTPLAASIDAVLEDLEAFADQPRLVVMLTDGEETCEGDVAASVDQLIEAGIDVRLNIVGFHIDDASLQADFERFAARGSGEYFDSQDGDALVEGLAKALAATWQVVDQKGEVVASGRVGDKPVELDVGEYALVVETQSGEQRQTFEVAPRASLEIPVQASAGMNQEEEQAW